MADSVQDTGYLLQNFMEHMTDNIYFKDRESRLIMVNKSFADWAGMRQEDVIGKTDFDLFASAHAQEAFDDEQRIVATGEPIIGIEEKETWEDGRITWVSTTKLPLKNSSGDIIGTFGISRDITDYKEAELRASYYADQIRRIKDEMEEDVHMAAELQKTFFPRSYPVYPAGVKEEESKFGFYHYYSASGGVSGDFCTIQHLSESTVGIFLCDVMGHGVRAALVTALICALVEENAAVEEDPGKFLDRMNAQLLPILRQEDIFLFATASYMVLDMETGTLNSANAGHPVPLHFQALENRAAWLMDDPGQRGPALAIAEDIEYKTFERSIAVGDSVVMYTDGLYEVVGDDDEELGEDRLLAAASHQVGKRLKEALPGLIEEIRRFSADGTFDDDICMAGFRRRSE